MYMKSQALLLHQVLEAEVGESPITIRALIPKNVVGACIGLGGETHRDLERQFETAIAFGASSHVGARLASIAGTTHQVARTWRECAFLMYRRKCPVYGQKLSVDLLIPNLLAQKLCETSEDNDCELTEIAVLSGATLVLKKDALGSSTERVLQVFLDGLDLQELLQFETAIRLLGRSFQRYTHLAFSPDNIYYIPGHGVGDAEFGTTDGQENKEDWSFSVEINEKRTVEGIDSSPRVPNGNLYMDNFMETSWARLQQPAGAADSPNPNGDTTTNGGHSTNNQRLRSSVCTVRLLVSNLYTQSLFRRDHSSQMSIFRQMQNRYSAERMHITPITSTPSTVPRNQFCYLGEPSNSMNWSRHCEDLKWPRVIHFIVDLDKVSGITSDIARLLNGEMQNAPESLLRLILSELAIQCLTSTEDELSNLRSSTGCNIWICDENLGDSDERAVIITGNYAKIGKAANKIYSTINSKLRLADIHKPIRHYNPVESVPPEDAALSGW
ncbi:hypothetical protein K450DRAFT_231305 [Umbelopsis ramanniana AG]|uniref:K Homology domain-containing protein n=1 Tax=Umbelopsis ramanniana AG TaxID=1314678 RepID=A0AAD5HG73_UMBRA|nr:uncharacterized protein K450DRAFT_231305 [Umbelopsis ramanniana AG]KAI8581819.1 hypothetical protein K450DRAFT_231305 [Umbelopsis ramanniana AG]